MTKTAIATEEPKEEHTCPTCGSEMVYSDKLQKWICEQCLHGAFLTDQAQREAVRRYRQTEKGKEAEKKYEQSEKGKKARERYLKSAKYKAARKRYTQRLKESLAIARAAHLERPTALAKVEEAFADERAALIQDIREFIDSSNKLPTTTDVRTWAESEYKLKLTDEQIRSLIQRAQKH